MTPCSCTVCRVVSRMVWLPYVAGDMIQRKAIACERQAPPGDAHADHEGEGLLHLLLACARGAESRSSCRYMPWNFTSCWSSSTIAPVELVAQALGRWCRADSGWRP